MKRITVFLVIASMLAAMSFNVFAAGNDDGIIKISLMENDEVISGNPGKGWVRYSAISSGLSDELLNLISTGYARYNWSEIEPKEGEYNWTLIDSALESWASVGKRFAFGVMNANTASPDDYVTPKWVFDAGAQYTRMSNNASADGLTTASGQYIPVWDDAVYLRKVSDFVKALAERYDGDQRLAFVDIRSYGNYGETHLLRLESANSKALDYEGEKKHIDIYADNFKKTKLIYPTANKSTQNDISNYAVSKNIGLRYDGICQDATSGILLKNAKGKATAVFEFALPYENLKATKSGNRSWNEKEYRDAFNRGEPSYMDLGQYNNDSEAFYKDNKKLVTLLTNKMGYHFTAKDFSLEKTFSADNDVKISAEIENLGITKLFEPGFSAVSLLDESNNEVQRVWLDSFNPQDFEAGKISSYSGTIRLEDVQDGNYKLAFGIFYDKDDAYPAYKLGNYGIDDTNWYQIAALKNNGAEFVAEDPYIHINASIYLKTVHDGVSYLPLRKCFEGVGAVVNWDAEKGVSVNLENSEINLKDGVVYINGYMDTSGIKYIQENGVTYIDIGIFNLLGCFNSGIDQETGAYVFNTLKYELGENNKEKGTISDGGFENRSNAWSFNNAYFEYSDEVTYSGKYALKVKNNEKEQSAEQSFDITAGNEYEISFAVNDASPVAFVISDNNENVLFKDTVQRGDGDWKEYSFDFGYDYSALTGNEIGLKIAFVSADESGEASYVDSVVLKSIGEIKDDKDGLFGDNSIETNRTKWTGRNGASFSRTSENPHSGKLCGVIENRLGTWYGGMIDVYDTLMEAGPGKYKYEGWFRTATGEGKMGITLYAFKINGALDIKKEFEISEEWTYLSFECELTQEQYDNTFSAYALIMGRENCSESENIKNIYFDDIKLTKISD